jgi:uncharacterized protein YecE (DUF72 family)
MLSYYARYFDTVELNNSFYHLPLPSSFDHWQETTPRKFLFAVKASRFITHMKKLKDPEESIVRFFENSARLEDKLGPILFQLPPKWRVNIERLDEFLAVLPRKHRYAFEFRDDSWLQDAVYKVLTKHNAAFCIHDMGGRQTQYEMTADFTYVRFHGPTEARYSGSYSSKTLEGWAIRVEKWRKSLSAAYLYFNNDVGGHAVENALALKKLVGA